MPVTLKLAMCYYYVKNRKNNFLQSRGMLEKVNVWLKIEISPKLIKNMASQQVCTICLAPNSKFQLSSKVSKW
jgi:hypothetical protein